MGEWQTFRFGDVTINYDSKRIPIRSAARKRGVYPYYGASGIVDDVDDYLFDGEQLLVAEAGENLRTRKTPIGFMATEKFWVNNHAHIVQGNTIANTRYLGYALAGTDIAGFLSGSTQPKLTQNALNRIELRLPERWHQDAVVTLLGALDDKIAVNERIADVTRSLGEATFRAALGRSSIERDLDSISVALIRGVTPRYSDDPDELVVLNQKCIRGGRVSLDPARRTIAERVSDEKIVRRGDILVNSTGVGTLGRVARWTGAVKCTADSHVTIVRLDENKIDPVCAGFAVLAAQPEIERLGEGSTGQTELSRAKLGSFRVILPDSDGCAALRPILEALEERADAAIQESTTLAQLRDTLLPKLMSGELRVRDAERAVAQAT